MGQQTNQFTLTTEVIMENEDEVNVNHDPIGELKKEITEMKSSFTSLQQEVKHLREKTYNKRRQILLYNIKEKERESIEDLHHVVLSFLRQVVEVPINIDMISFVKRLGVRKGCRPILVQVNTVWQRIMILKASKKLKFSRFKISPDYPAQIREIRRKLLPYMRDARKKNQKAFLKNDKLFIQNRFYTLKELEISNTKNQHTANLAGQGTIINEIIDLTGDDD